MTNNTPIDEYYFWKNLIEEKKDAGEAVPSDMCELLVMAEAKMAQFLTKNHCLSSDVIVPENKN